MKTTLRFACVIVLIVFLAGCVTTQGPQGQTRPNLLSALDALESLNPFDTTGQEFRRLVNDKKFAEAQSYFNDKFSVYFEKKYMGENQLPSKELSILAEWLYEQKFSQKVLDSTANLQSIRNAGTLDDWTSYSAYLRSAINLMQHELDDRVLVASKISHANQSISGLNSELIRVDAIFKANRPQSFEDTFEFVIQRGVLPPEFPGKAFDESEYSSSAKFQSLVLAYLDSIKSDDQRLEANQKLAMFTSADTRRRVSDDVVIRKSRDKLFADGRIDVGELGAVRQLIKDYGTTSGLNSIVKIGFVDLASTPIRDRGAHDFDVVFDRDYLIEILDAKNDLLEGGKLSNYDFLFVADISSAKILRDFKNKQEIASKRQTGTRQEQNPAYIQAYADYQQAVADLQKTKLENAIQGSRPCYGNVWVCALAGGVRGATEGVSENVLKQKAAILSYTSQTVTVPVYSEYAYQLVDVNLSKTAHVDYYIIDVKSKKVYSNRVAKKDSEKYILSYNVDQNDPEKESIFRNSQNEGHVTAWEKRPLNISLASLFDPASLSSSSKPFTTAEAFLKPISGQKHPSAVASYSSGSNPENSTQGAYGAATNSKTRVPVSAAKGTVSSHVSMDAETIADQRFSSVVVIKNSKSIGGGFFITPELILTANHVVESSNFVEIAFYDGTKTIGRVIDHDVRLDLAIVKSQTTGKPAKIHSGPIRLGETVEAIGHPKGYDFTITRGVISAVRKQGSLTLKTGAPVEFVQTDTPISPGNSGGPLFLKDAVVGVNDWARVDKASQSLNFSVSYNEIRNYLDRLNAKPE